MSDVPSRAGAVINRPARPEAAPDLGDEGRGVREVLYDEDRADTSQRRVREAERRADVVRGQVGEGGVDI